MVKNSSSNRFKSAKTHASKAPAKAPATKDEEQKTKKRQFRPSVKAARREKYYSTGKGSTGLLVSRPRLVRVIRNARKAQTLRYAELTGIEPKGKRQVLSRGFVDVSLGALDAYANRIMEVAATLAKGRRTVRIEDIECAHRMIQKITHQ